MAVENAILVLLAFLSQKRARKQLYNAGMVIIFLDFILGEILGALLLDPASSLPVWFHGPVPVAEIVLLPALFIASAFILHLTGKNLDISRSGDRE